MPRRFDFHNFITPTNPEEAEAAVKQFLIRVENELPTPPNLLKFIANGIAKQYHSGNISCWTGKKAGRPSIPADDQLNMLAWFLFHFDKEFCKQSKTTEDGRFSNIAKRFTEAANCDESDLAKYRIYHTAEALSKRTQGLHYLNSESSVKRAVEDFQKDGLYDDELYSGIHNQHTIETFCLIVLKLSPIKADCMAQKIFNHWKKHKVQK